MHATRLTWRAWLLAGLAVLLLPVGAWATYSTVVTQVKIVEIAAGLVLGTVTPDISMNAGATDAKTTRTREANDSSLVTDLAALLARVPALGPALKAASIPVTLATDQAPLGDLGAGAVGAATQRVTLADNSPGVSLLTIIAGWVTGVGNSGAGVLRVTEGGRVNVNKATFDLGAGETEVLGFRDGRKGFLIQNQDADGEALCAFGPSSTNGAMISRISGYVGGSWGWPNWAGRVTCTSGTGGATVTVKVQEVW